MCGAKSTTEANFLHNLGYSPLDNAIVALLAQSESELQRLLEQMTAQVETYGSPLDDVVVESDLILPPTDLTLVETAELFTGEGIIPG